MAQILKLYGIPMKIINAIMILYRDTKSMVRSPDGDTEYFDINAGVLQGDTLAPLLFIITLDYVLRTSIDENKDLTQSKQRSRRYTVIKITDAEYADDLVIFVDSSRNAEKLLNVLEKSGKTVGRKVNIKKTSHMNINSNKTVTSIYGDVLKNFDNFIYLGSEIESTDKEIKIRIAKSWAALDNLSSIWKSPLSTTLNRNFFRAIVESVLLYGSEAWILTKKHEKKPDGTYTIMLRAILNISWKEHPTKIRLYGNILPLTSIIRIRRIRFAGHCYRSEE